MRRTLPYFSKLAQPANQAIIDLLEQARKEILISAATLDFNVFRSESIVDIVKQMLTNSKEIKINILVDDDKDFVNRCVRLAETARRIPSIIELRKPGPDADPAQQITIIVDSTHAFVQKYDSRDSFHVFSDDRATARQYRRDFMALWDFAEASDELKQLDL